MSAKIWYRRWTRSFYRLLKMGAKPYKSDKQRKKDRERRLKAKYSQPKYFKKKRTYKRRRSDNEIFLSGIFDFFATSLICMLLLPLELFRSLKKTKNRKQKGAFKPATQNTREAHSSKAHPPSMTMGKMTENSDRKTEPISSVNPYVSVVAPTNIKNTAESGICDEPLAPSLSGENIESPSPITKQKEFDEDTPKSIPKNEQDQYIRKRMIIAGSS